MLFVCLCIPLICIRWLMTSPCCLCVFLSSLFSHFVSLLSYFFPSFIFFSFLFLFLFFPSPSFLSPSLPSLSFLTFFPLVVPFILFSFVPFLKINSFLMFFSHPTFFSSFLPSFFPLLYPLILLICLLFFGFVLLSFFSHFSFPFKPFCML